MLSGRIFITGGAGFLGRAIIKRAMDEKWDAEFTAFSRDENKLMALKREYPAVTVLSGSVSGSLAHLTASMAGHDVVIHAGANKHVDFSEQNAVDTIAINVHGSEQVARACVSAGVKRCIGISTDKAANPINTYGASKLLMERILIEANRWGDCIFTLARYGNVIGSTGSVITVWEKQQARDNTITITDPNMTRFWLTANRAVDLMLEAYSAQAGMVVIPLLPALKIDDLRRWFMPDAYHVVTGLRPGEKIHECLVTESEAPRCYPNFDGLNTVHLAPQKIIGGSKPCMLSAYTSDNPTRFINQSEVSEMLA